MSSTNRGAVRQPHDLYPTPQGAFLPMFDEFIPDARTTGYKWLEPAAGDFRIFDHMPRGSEWAEIQRGSDYFAKSFSADIGMTNPPFSMAVQFAEKMLQECEAVAILQRLNWLGSQERRKFWQELPPTHLFILSERPVFVWACKGGKRATNGCGNTYPVGHDEPCTCGGRVRPATDSVEYGWFVWDRLRVMKRMPGIYVL